jgi:hypothetical protein
MSPSQSIIAEAYLTKDVPDATGRILTIRRPTTLDRLRLFKAVGPSLATNERYLGIAVLAFCVTAIDGIPVPQPTNEQYLEQAVQRLGDHGIAAVADALLPDDTEGLAVAGSGN